MILEADWYYGEILSCNLILAAEEANRRLIQTDAITSSSTGHPSDDLRVGLPRCVGLLQRMAQSWADLTPRSFCAVAPGRWWRRPTTEYAVALQRDLNTFA